MVYHVEYERSLPERRPDGHVPAAPRYSLRWIRPVSALVSDYFAPCFDGFETTASRADRSERGARPSSFHTIVTRRSTPGPDYQVGLVRTKDSQIVPITTNGYFGAARDRLPISAIDPLDSPCGDDAPEAAIRVTKGRRLRVSVPVNVVTLRSGQYWAHAEGEQLEDYVDNMRPRLMTGMDYLQRHKRATGTLALRVMTNLEDDGTARRETSVLAHFVSLGHLEQWASSHETHLDIYRHAIAMSRKFGKDRQFVSWHELFVLPRAEFEYVNCHPSTGLLPYFEASEIGR